MINTWEHRHSINPRGRNHWARLYDRRTTHSIPTQYGRGLVTHMHIESRDLVALGYVIQPKGLKPLDLHAGRSC